MKAPLLDLDALGGKQSMGTRMKVQLLYLSDPSLAIFGLGLSYGITSDMRYLQGCNVWDNNPWDTLQRESCWKLAKKLAHKQGGHNKFLESITLTLDITAPRYWWQEFDTYRIGVTKQSESTIHTLTKRDLTDGDFIVPPSKYQLEELNALIHKYKNPDLDKHPAEKHAIFMRIKALLPEGFLQRRIVVLNAKTLQNIIAQRIDHILDEWHIFCKRLRLELPEFICDCVFPIERGDNK